MKFSEQWLREWVNPDISTDELVAQITMAGLEVDAVEPVAGSFTQVVVGEIVAIEQHPDADKLRVCQVAGNPEGNVQVVCGAANARLGLKIPFALVGAELPGEDKPFKIKKAKLRGVESFGMLCAEQELGMAEHSDGLMELPADAPVGQCLREYLQLDDNIIDVDLTPNRGDCLSIQGLAREVGVLNQQPLTVPSIDAVKPAIQDDFAVELKEPAACSRYAGRVIRNLDVSKASPLWLQEKLRRSGIRSIDAVVDVTNYVLLELGQPMHAFDLAKLSGGIEVRYGKQDEQLKLLDGQTVTLSPDTLVIADHQQALAIAGVMGGASSAVSETTRDVFLESAYFDPIVVAGKARSYGLHTDSSHRFERGVNFALQEKAIERATALLLEICGGEAGPLVLKESTQHLPERNAITLRQTKIRQYLGFDMPAAEVEQVLKHLEMQFELIESCDAQTGQWAVQPPSWRFDIAIEVDLIEELARIYGYNQLPISSVSAKLELKTHSEQKLPLSVLKQRLCSLGFTEAITYSFVDPVLQQKVHDNEGQVGFIPVKNPISADMGVMRASLLPGLLNAARNNIKRQQDRIRLFETGLIFRESADTANGYGQSPVLGMLLTGAAEPEQWYRSSPKAADFYDLKGSFEALIALTGTSGEDWKIQQPDQPLPYALHPGQSAEVFYQGKAVGFIAALHPALQEELDFPAPVFVLQVAIEPLCAANVPHFEPLSRYPSVRRDIALLVNRDLAVKTLCEQVKKTAGTYLENLKVFDVYSGEGIDPHRKSVALGLTFRDKSRTLTDSDINENIDKVLAHLRSEFGAELRN